MHDGFCAAGGDGSLQIFVNRRPPATNRRERIQGREPRNVRLPKAFSRRACAAVFGAAGGSVFEARKWIASGGRRPRRAPVRGIAGQRAWASREEWWTGARPGWFPREDADSWERDRAWGVRARGTRNSPAVGPEDTQLRPAAATYVSDILCLARHSCQSPRRSRAPSPRFGQWNVNE